MSFQNPVGAMTMPSTLEEERQINSYMTDNRSSSLPNEGALLTMMTFKERLKNGTMKNTPAAEAKLAAYEQLENEEVKYIELAIMALTDPGPHSDKLRSKYGKNLTAAISLAQVIKAASEEEEYKRMMQPIVDESLLTPVTAVKGATNAHSARAKYAADSIAARTTRISQMYAT